MGDLTSARPVSGAPIATTWGTEVHDAIEGIQTGVVAVTVAGTQNGQATVTFPRPYVAAPVVVVTFSSGSDGWISSVNAPTATSVVVRVQTRAGVTSNATLNVQWVAIGTLAV